MENTQFVDELYRQPEALRNCVRFYMLDEGAALLLNAAKILKQSDAVMCTGMGTSLYSPYLLEREISSSGLAVKCIDAGELLHFGLNAVGESSAILAISQSGESAETKAVTEHFAGKRPLLAIVNNSESSMARAADITLPLMAGDEQSISAKTYTNTLAVLLLLTAAMKNESHADACARLLKSADLMELSMGKTHKAATEAAAFFREVNNLHVVARGRDLVTARQLALILKEGAGLFTEALSGGLFRHGPIELAGKGHAAIFIASEGNAPELTVNLATETAGHGSRVLLLTDSRKDVPESILNIALQMPDHANFPISCAHFIGLFVHELAKLAGKEAGVFRHASKITDRE